MSPILINFEGCTCANGTAPLGRAIQNAIAAFDQTSGLAAVGPCIVEALEDRVVGTVLVHGKNHAVVKRAGNAAPGGCAIETAVAAFNDRPVRFHALCA